MTALEFLLAAAAVFVIYAVLSRGLFLATEWARQSVVNNAATLIESPSLSAEEKDEIRDSLDTVHSALCAWMLVGVAVWALVKLPFRGEPKDIVVPPVLRDTYISFGNRWLIATVGNSLFATALFVLIFLIAAAAHVSFEMVARSVVATRRHHRRHHHAPA